MKLLIDCSYILLNKLLAMKKLLFAFLLIGLLSSVAYSQKNKVALSVEERYNSISYEREIVRSLNIQSTFRFGTDQSLIVSSYFSPLEIPQRVFEIVRISPVVFGSYGYEYDLNTLRIFTFK